MASDTAETSVGDTAVGSLDSAVAAGGAPMPHPLLASTRPQRVSEAVEKAAAAISRRQGDWGVDGEWSYDFSKLGYACAATSHSGAKPDLSTTDGRARDVHRAPHNSSSPRRCDVLKDSFSRTLRSGGAHAAFRVLDLGAGTGGWLLQAQRELEESVGGSPAIHLHGVTGDALPSHVRAMNPSEVKERYPVEVAHFQQVGIETFPFRLGGDAPCGSEEPRGRFARTVEAMLAGGGLEGEGSGNKRGYDLIVSSWTFCHLIDPLATLELWSNALAVDGELYVNDIDFLVVFEGESTSADLTSPHGRKGDAGGDSTGVAQPWEQHSEPRGVRPVDDDHHAFWESDPEGRMERAFEVLNRHGKEDQAFSIEFVYNDENYRTAVKVTRISAAPIRFAPVVGYGYEDDGDGGGTLLDSGGRPVYRVSGKLSEVDSTETVGSH